MKRKRKTGNIVHIKRNNKKNYIIYAGVVLLLVLMVFFTISNLFINKRGKPSVDVDSSCPEIAVELLDINEYSRPGIEVDHISGIVIHYTANPGSTAMNNRDYFNSLQDGHGGYVSSHFVVGLEGEIVQCIPTWELAYASNERNDDTISIECCHPDETGEFTDETYRSIVQLTAYLCAKYNLDEDVVIRHYDVTGKICPKYFVENEDAWEQFKIDVAAALEKGSEEAE
ncbi:MAG: peptidoglycan recognition family protein [Schaedlerella sp.]|nr:peptidoglycan recognition family protein [Schaedlerella sp.]